jgi:hypothetical protein
MSTLGIDYAEPSCAVRDSCYLVQGGSRRRSRPETGRPQGESGKEKFCKTQMASAELPIILVLEE